MKGIMELILYCASFVTHDVEMLGAYAYDNVILLWRVVVQYCHVLVCLLCPQGKRKRANGVGLMAFSTQDEL